MNRSIRTNVWSYQNTPDNSLIHFGVKGMRWRHRKRQEESEKTTSSIEKSVYALGAKLNPREMKYELRKATNIVNKDTESHAELTSSFVKQYGVLPANAKALKSIESVGINAHKKAVYHNLDKSDLHNLKVYTDSARYSRGVNGYLAIRTPKEYAADAAKLKKTLSKNMVNDQTVYRSCNLKFSTNGLGKKLDIMSEADLQKAFGGFSKNFAGKSVKENRVFSTSTSPLFAIDTWRKVNPTAAKTYNTYMIINTKNCPGLLADGRTSSGYSLVNTKSNQEAILAPNKLTYKKMEFDKERGMFAVTVEAS